ncbi:MAG TPA: hypothetical protein VFD49_13365, partial [Candidatus Dormibacteraeota bacterium]|nr:hypothetical protein [Candidatus Dormibacteraeota bacterium]
HVRGWAGVTLRGSRVLVLHIRVPRSLEGAIGPAEIDQTSRSEWVRRAPIRAGARRVAKRR